MPSKNWGIFPQKGVCGWKFILFNNIFPKITFCALLQNIKITSKPSHPKGSSSEPLCLYLGLPKKYCRAKHCADFIGTQRNVWKSFQHNNSVCSPRSVAKSFLIFFFLASWIFAKYLRIALRISWTWRSFFAKHFFIRSYFCNGKKDLLCPFYGFL